MRNAAMLLVLLAVGCAQPGTREYMVGTWEGPTDSREPGSPYRFLSIRADGTGEFTITQEDACGRQVLGRTPLVFREVRRDGAGRVVFEVTMMACTMASTPCGSSAIPIQVCRVRPFEAGREHELNANERTLSVNGPSDGTTFARLSFVPR